METDRIISGYIEVKTSENDHGRDKSTGSKMNDGLLESTSGEDEGNRFRGRPGKGLCKVKHIPQIKKNLDRVHPNHPPPIQFFFLIPITDMETTLKS